MKLFAVAALLLASSMAGCTSSTSGADPEADEGHDDLGLAAVPVLYLNVTVGNQTFRFTSGDAGGALGGGNGTSTGTTTVSSGNGTSAKGNATGNAGGAAASNATSSTPGGDAPLDVSATLEASRLPANASLAWSIDFGDDGTAAAGNATGNATASGKSTATGNATASGNGTGKAGLANGTTLPAKARHTYLQPGSYEIRSLLRQGDKTLGSLRVALLVGGNGTDSKAGLPSGTEVGPAPALDGEGSFDVGLVVLCSEAGSFDWVIPATDEATGTPLALKDLTVTLSGGSTNLDADLEVYGPDGELIDESTGSSNAETVTAEGPFPAGTFRVVVVGCGGVAASFTVHGEGLLVAA